MRPAARGVAAHPRSRGEHRESGAPTQARGGSSPLTRGAQGRKDRRLRLSGLIPAHAGSTSTRSCQPHTRRAHPRSRGEHADAVPCEVQEPGSSPLTRGALRRRRLQHDRPRLIPAHAGSTRLLSDCHHLPTAHPRSRGEHLCSKMRERALAGSSPLTRGAQVTNLFTHTTDRLIPAHAGSTPPRRGPRTPTTAHPRSRGEHPSDPTARCRSSGSSPLTRGAPNRLSQRRQRQRLIPAHAGSTRIRHRGFHQRTAHPRSRGEHILAVRLASELGGSSPLTRGARISRRKSPPLRRLIPAHAGSTRRRCTSSGVHAAHPRSRGEHSRACARGDPEGGSSPLTRGAQPSLRSRRSRRRLIPAHAGSTH